MKAKVSIIVPVYNVQDYLEESIQSIRYQTYKNLEIILINDGSTDSSKEICLKHSQEDERIVLINQTNGGAAAAKNTGLRNATGEYITFVDSDDILPEDSIEYRVNLLVKENADIVQGKFINLFTDGLEVTTQKSFYSICSQREYMKQFLKNWENALFWNKLFKKKVLENIYFIEGRCIDDEFFTYKTIFKASKIVVSERIIYYYRMRVSSAIHNTKNNIQKQRDQIDFMYLRYLDIKDTYDSEICRIYIENLVDNYMQFFRKRDIDKENFLYMRHVLKKLKNEMDKLPIHLKLWLMLYRYLPINILKLFGKKEEEQQLDLHRYYK